MCYGCGQIIKKELSERTHSYPFRGLILNRDHNAAINIRVGDYDLYIKSIDTPNLSEGQALV